MQNFAMLCTTTVVCDEVVLLHSILSNYCKLQGVRIRLQTKRATVGCECALN